MERWQDLFGPCLGMELQSNWILQGLDKRKYVTIGDEQSLFSSDYADLDQLMTFETYAQLNKVWFGRIELVTAKRLPEVH